MTTTAGRVSGLGERRRLLEALLDTIYIEPEDGKVVAVQPKPATARLFAKLGAKLRLGFARGATAENARDIKNAAEPTAAGVDGGTVWWRRGRIGLPHANIGNLLLPQSFQPGWQARIVGWKAAA